MKQSAQARTNNSEGVRIVFKPDDRMLKLVEIQESVLPEEEYIIGISDMDYFKGVGFSMPIPFDKGYFQELQDSGLKLVNSDDETISSSSAEGEPIASGGQDDLLESQGEFVTDMSDDVMYGSMTIQNEDGTPIVVNSENQIVEFMEHDMESNNLYAFLPGRFYCSNQRTTVDGFLVEVTQRNLFGMTLTDFRPEDVRTFNVKTGLIVNEEGETSKIRMDLDALGKFRTNLLTKIDDDSGVILGATSTSEIAYNYELNIARSLAEKIPLSDLKQAYVSGSSAAGRLMKLFDDIQENGFDPVCKIYLRNEKHPNGKIINVHYSTLDSILQLEIKPGLECPNEMEQSLQLKFLCFLKLSGGGEEVDIEKAILDTCQSMKAVFGENPSMNTIVTHLFSEESS